MLLEPDDVGATWRDDTYPEVGPDCGAQVYQYHFPLKSDSSSMFTGREEIVDYTRRLAQQRGTMCGAGCNFEALSATRDEHRRAIPRESCVE